MGIAGAAIATVAAQTVSALLWGVIACILVYLFGEATVRFTTGTSDAATIENAVLSLRIHFPFYPVLGILLCLRTTMQAMGHKKAPVLSSCIELGMKILAAAVLIPRLGFLGACVTEPVTWPLMMLFLAAVYLFQRNRIFGTETACQLQASRA